MPWSENGLLTNGCGFLPWGPDKKEIGNSMQSKRQPSMSPPGITPVFSRPLASYKKPHCFHKPLEIRWTEGRRQK